MENKITKSLVIIGGGPAGLAAAVAAAENGLPAEDILILERDGRLGGILNQCIHNGFGLHTFKEELTGPEYAARFEERAKALHIPYKLGAMVLSISPEKVVTAVSREDGLFTVEAGAVILAMGCRERSRGARVLRRHGAAPCQYGGLYARARGRHSRLRRYRSHHGAPHDVRGREGTRRRGAPAVLRRPQAQYRSVSR